MRITRSTEDPEQPRACAYKRGVAGPNEMQQYGGRIQKRRKTRDVTWSLHGLSSATKRVYGELRRAVNVLTHV